MGLFQNDIQLAEMQSLEKRSHKLVYLLVFVIILPSLFWIHFNLRRLNLEKILRIELQLVGHIGLRQTNQTLKQFCIRGHQKPNNNCKKKEEEE